MPCKCSGFRYEKCKCKLLGPRFALDEADGQLMVLTRKDQYQDSQFKHPIVRPQKRNFCFRILEHLYEKCAGYNLRRLVVPNNRGWLVRTLELAGERENWMEMREILAQQCDTIIRYCPFRGYVGTSCANEALRDLLMLLCFLLANFVVFTTIVTRMTVHVTLAVVGTVRWITRSFSTKIITCNDDTRLVYPGQPHDFSPHRRRSYGNTHAGT